MNRSEAGKLGAEKSKLTIKIKHERFVERYNNNPKLCTQCSKPLDYDKRYNDFCSQSCSATYNNRRLNPKVFPRNKNCIQCGKLLSGNSKKYCSTSCNANYRFEKGITNSANAVRSYLIRNQGIVCSMCGNTHWLGQPINLEVDHIDGNSENNSIQNIRLVCPNCHSTTPTYRNKNKGHGRVNRRNIYQRGIIK